MKEDGAFCVKKYAALNPTRFPIDDAMSWPPW